MGLGAAQISLGAQISSGLPNARAQQEKSLNQSLSDTILTKLSCMSQDDPANKGNKRGRITFATSGPNTRSTQVCVCARACVGGWVGGWVGG
jgi:hypothetical protein